jgi:hypothetical protein
VRYVIYILYIYIIYIYVVSRLRVEDYRPCYWCWVDTQWFQDIDVSSPINICIYYRLNRDWGVGKPCSFSCVVEECCTSEKWFEFWGERNSVWFCMSCRDYLKKSDSTISPGAMSPVRPS